MIGSRVRFDPSVTLFVGGLGRALPGGCNTTGHFVDWAEGRDREPEG